MEKFNVIGRTEELTILQGVLEATEAQFVAVYGRRRIGKTYLISEFFKNKGVYFEITGMKDGELKDQLFQFTYEFSRRFNDGDRIPAPESWSEAFTLLNDAIERVSKKEKIILFFDEIPWLASKKSKFLPALEHFWNRYLSRNPNIILVICGSSASWIIKNIINNKGGLHGRVTKKIRLLPFSLSETETYLLSKNIKLERKQITDLYLAIGGVPKYLSYVKRGQSAVQTINDLCFSPNGDLNGEFNNLYKSLFENYERHILIVSALSKATYGLTKDELLQKTKLSSGGSSSKLIQELIDAGFITYLPSFMTKKSMGIYRLIDEYSHFYLTWMEGTKDEQFWIKKQGTPKWYSWCGYAFESLCLKHVLNIKKALGISGLCTTESEWHSKEAQIDLIISRDDRCINLLELKYCESEFLIDKSYASALQNKKNIFKQETTTKKTLFTTLVTTFGIKKNSYSLSVVDNELSINDLF